MTGKHDLSAEWEHKGARLVENGQYDEAITFWRDVLEQLEGGGGTHIQQVTVLCNLGSAYHYASKLDDALVVLQRAKSLLEGVDSHAPAYSLCLHNLGTLHLDFGQYAMAELHLKVAFEIRKEYLGADDRTTLYTANSLGYLYYLLGSFEAALELQTETWQLRQSRLGPNHPETLTSQNNLASLYMALGWYQEAICSHRQVLAVRLKTMGLDHAHTYYSCTNLGFAYLEQGQWQRAQKYLEKALVGFERLLGHMHANSCIVRNNLAHLHVKTANFAQAERFYQKSVDTLVASMGADHPLTVQGRHNFSNFYAEVGRGEKALGILQEVLAWRRENLGPFHLNTLMTQSLIASIKYEQGDYVRARELMQVVFLQRKDLLGSDHPSTVAAQDDLAACLVAQGNAADAVSLLEKSLDFTEQKRGLAHPDRITVLQNLAYACDVSGAHDKAEQHYLAALEQAKQNWVEYHPTTLNVLKNLGIHYARMGKLQRADVVFQQGFENSQRCLSAFVWATGDMSRRAFSISFQDFRNPYLQHFSGRGLSGARAILQFSCARKGFLLSVAAYRQSIQKDDDNCRRIKVLRTALASTVLSPLDRTGTPADSQCEKWNDEIQRLEQVLNVPSSMMKRPCLDDVVAGLAQDEVLIDYVVFTKHRLDDLTPLGLYVTGVLVTGGAQPKFRLVDLGRLEELWSLYERYLTALRGPGSLRAAKVLGQELYQALLGPFYQDLAGHKILYLVPDDCLNRISFACLVQPNGKYLVEQWTPVLLPGYQRFVEKESFPPKKPAQVNVFYNPDFGQMPEWVDQKEVGSDTQDNPLSLLAPLKHSIEEGKAIIRICASAAIPVTDFTEQGASARAFLDLASSGVLHIATHGQFQFEWPPPYAFQQHGPMRSKKFLGQEVQPYLQSYLAFAGVNDWLHGTKFDHAPIVTALEVAGLNLDPYQLVVFSSCLSGDGACQQGEGVFGLYRAALEAGAQEVMSSYWPLGDAATAEFMQTFYSLYLEGRTARAALQETQRAFIRHLDTRSPYFWAGFDVVGR